MTLGIMTLSKMTFGITTFDRRFKKVELNINTLDTECRLCSVIMASVVMLSGVPPSNSAHYSQRDYAGCHYAECRGAMSEKAFVFSTLLACKCQ
jgi:hypothetical protein